MFQKEIRPFDMDQDPYQKSGFFLFLFCQYLEKFFGRLGKYLVFFPYDAHFDCKFRRERAECEPAVPGGVDDTVKGYGVS